jgi:hypothetical protein
MPAADIPQFGSGMRGCSKAQRKGAKAQVVVFTLRHSVFAPLR